MVLILPSLFHGAAANTYTAAKLRRLAQSLVVDWEGVLSDDDLRVVADSPASLRVRVSAGRAWVNGDNVARQGAYLVENDATATTPFAGAAHASLPRVDLLVVRIHDSAADGGSDSTDTDAFEVIAGTAAASPVAPAVPANAIPLAELTIPAASAVITTITDRRPQAAFTPPAANLLGNAWFDNWSRGTSAAPDGWTISGTGATVSQSTTFTDGARFGALVSSTLSQALSFFTRLTPATGTDPNVVALRGKVLTFSARVYASAAARVGLQLNDNVGVSLSPVHSGSGAFETLTVQRVIDPAAVNSIVAVLGISAAAAINAVIAKPTLYLGPRTAVLIQGPPPQPITELYSGRVYERGIAYLGGYGAAGGTMMSSQAFQTRKAAAPTVTLSGFTYANASGGAVSIATVDGVAFTYVVTALGMSSMSASYDAVV